MSEPVFQSALGTVDHSSNRKDKTWNNGSLNVGSVTKMHHKRSTADTAVLHGPNVIMSKEEQEGKNAPVLCSAYAGYDEEFEKPYGSFIPLQASDRPVIVYAENEKSKPILVGVMHHTDDDVGEVNLHDILPTEYPIDEDDKREYLRQIWIHRCQDGITIDGENGEFEISSHTKSFIRSCSANQDEEKFDYEDLVLKDKMSIAMCDPKTIHLGERRSFPLKYFAVFRNRYQDEETDYLRFCVDASKVAFKWMQQKPNEDRLTYSELEESGGIKVRRQLDSVERGAGNEYTEAEITEEGVAKLTRKSPVCTTTCELKEDGAYLDIDGGASECRCTKDQILLKIGASEIRITGNEIVINSPTVRIN